MAVIKDSEVRKLRCELTPEEQQKKAERLAELLQQQRDTEAELRASKSRYKGRIEQLVAERERVLHDFSTGTEARDVRCDLALDFDTGLATWIRTDTGEPLWSRPISDIERQRPLFPDGGGDEGDADGDAAEGEPSPRRGRKGTAPSETSGATAL